MDVLDHKRIGKRLETKRLETELSSRKFAIKAKIDPSQYSKIEKGELPITEKTLEKLVGTYALDKDYILYGTNVPREIGPKAPSKSILNLTESHKMLADSNLSLSKSHEKLVNLVESTEYGDKENTLDAVSRSADFLELLADIASGKKFESKQEALAALSRFVPLPQSNKL